MLSVSPALLADIGGPGSSNPSAVVEVNGIGYFSADDGVHGRELWRTDGSPEGTYIVADINPGIASSSPEIINFNGTLFFKATVSGSGADLWKTDGTSTGTVLVADIPATTSNNAIRDKTVVGSLLFFVTADANNDWELWRSDGSAAGTYQVRNIRSSGSSFPSNLTNVGGTLFFQADDGINGDDLWKSDGTMAGTVRVGYVNGAKNQYPSALTNVAGTLYFTTGNGLSRSLWSSDGTAAGTKSIFGLADNLTSFEGSLYFSQTSKLYRKTATATPQLIADIQPDETGGSIFQIAPVGDKLYFAGRTKTLGTELWLSDGTAVGTGLVTDIAPGAASAGVQHITDVAGTAYFTVNAAVAGGAGELWKSNGTAAGTTHVHGWSEGVNAEPNGLRNVAGTLYFSVFDLDAGREVWKSDGTAAGTRRVRDINPLPDADSTPHSFTPVGAITYFVADTLEHGSELWKTDGTTAGTVLVKDIHPGQSGTAVRYLTNVNGLLMFLAASDGSMGTIWRSDGTEAGTYAVDETELPGNSFLLNPLLTNVNGALYFNAYRSLWTSDGTAAGTHPVSGAAKLAASYSYGNKLWNQIAELDNDVYYVGTRLADDDFSLFYELWKYDTVRSVHTKLADLNEVPTAQQVFDLRSAGGLLYFPTVNGDLWRTDGTLSGTSLLANSIQVFNTSEDFADVSGRFFFVGRDSDSREELWTSDGTPAGTRRVADLAPGIAGSYPRNLTAVGDQLFFSTDASGDDWSLWVSDGTELGTHRVPNSLGLGPRALTNLNGRLYFQGAGLELWTSDGTGEGTSRVAPLKVVHEDITGEGMTNANGLLYFAGDDGVHGSEPWILAPPVVARLFYNNSKFDQVAGASDDADDAALAVDKLPYIPGNGRATSENVSSYSKGINGLFIDLASGHGEITADDFNFRMGTSTDPSGWNDAPAPISITVRAGAGIAGHDRVEIVFADDAIKNTWLEVTVRGNDARGGFHANTALNASSVFYFGSRVGDTFTGNSAAAAVTSAADALQIRAAGGTFAASGNRYDINRDGVVSAGDALLARFNSGILLMLDLPQLTDPPASPTMIAATQMADPLSSAVASALAETLARHVDASAAASSHASGLIDRVPTTGPPRANATAREAAAHFADEALLELTEGESLDDTAAEDDDRLLDALLSLP